MRDQQAIVEDPLYVLPTDGTQPDPTGNVLWAMLSYFEALRVVDKLNCWICGCRNQPYDRSDP